MAEKKTTTRRPRVTKTCAKHPDRKAVGKRPGRSVWPGIWVPERDACEECIR